MKKLFTVIPIVLLLAVACTQNNSITSPEVQSSERSWLPINDGSLAKFGHSTVEKKIRGDRGGFIAFNRGVLYIPRGAFEGTETITIENDNKVAAIDFGPSMQFDKDLICSVVYKHLDLSNVDPSNIEFGFMDGNNFYSVEYDRLVVDVRRGYLAVFGAKFDHFSRYGFTW